MMLRPAAVAMRAKNPSRRLRRRLEGWKVLFIFCSSCFSIVILYFHVFPAIRAADILRHYMCRFLKITPLRGFFKWFYDNIFTKRRISCNFNRLRHITDNIRTLFRCCRKCFVRLYFSRISLTSVKLPRLKLVRKRVTPSGTTNCKLLVSKSFVLK